MFQVLIIVGITIFVVSLILIIMLLIVNNTCVDNFASNLHISKTDAACLYKQFKKQKVPKNIINQLCNPLTSEAVTQIATELSIDTLSRIKQACNNCNISVPDILLFK
jgi:hypothetical protein